VTLEIIAGNGLDPFAANEVLEFFAHSFSSD
jgi:hypothetical protein